MSTNLPHPTTLRTCLLLLLAANPCAASNKQTPISQLQDAIKNKEPIDKIKTLIQKTGLVKENNAHILLKHFIQQNKLDIVQALIQQGIDINKKVNNKSQLFHALKSNNNEAIGLALLNASITIDLQEKDFSANTLLHLAMYPWHKNIAFALIAKYKHNDPALQYKNNHQQTVLHLACMHGNTDIAKALIAKMDTIHLEQDSSGNTPLHYALKKSTIALAMIPKIDNIDEADSYEETPLYKAVLSKQYKVVKALIQAGANPDKKITGNVTPRNQANAMNDPNMTPLLNTPSNSSQNQSSPNNQSTSFNNNNPTHHFPIKTITGITFLLLTIFFIHKTKADPSKDQQEPYNTRNTHTPTPKPPPPKHPTSPSQDSSNTTQA